MSKDVRGLGSWLKSHGPLCGATSSRRVAQLRINQHHYFMKQVSPLPKSLLLDFGL